MTRKIGPIGPVENGISAPKQGSAGGQAKHASSKYPAIKTSISNARRLWRENGGDATESEHDFLERIEREHEYKIDINTIRRYVHEADTMQNT
jgi:hypothetical protein